MLTKVSIGMLTLTCVRVTVQGDYRSTVKPLRRRMSMTLSSIPTK